MDQKINAHLESLVLGILNSPMFAGLPQDQKFSLGPKIRTYLNGVIIDTMVDKMTDEQLNAIKDLPADSGEMEDKIEEYATQIPFLAGDLEQKLNQAAADIKQNPQIVS